MKYLITAAIWTAYFVLHSYLISISFTKLIKLLLKKYYTFYRLFYASVSIVLLIPIINYTSQADNNIIFHYGPGLNTLRIILMITSILIGIWSFFIDYDALTFLGIRQILNFRNEKEINTEKELKNKGLLGLMRHPMYFATIIYFWSQTFRMVDIVVNTIITLYVIIGSYLEEKKLVLEFGDDYIEYQKKVPMLFPLFKIPR